MSECYQTLSDLRLERVLIRRAVARLLVLSEGIALDLAQMNPASQDVLWRRSRLKRMIAALDVRLSQISGEITKMENGTWFG